MQKFKIMHIPGRFLPGDLKEEPQLRSLDKILPRLKVAHIENSVRVLK